MEQADSDDNDTLDRHKRAKEELKKATKEKKNQELFNLIKSKVDVTCFRNMAKPEIVSVFMKEEQLIKELKRRDKECDTHKCRQMYNYYLIGYICYRLSRKNPNYHKSLEINVDAKYGARYCRSLVAFYELCCDYPALKYCGVGFRNFHSNMAAIRALIAADQDKEFWRRDD